MKFISIQRKFSLIGGLALQTQVAAVWSMALGMAGASVKMVKLGGETLKVNDLSNLVLSKNRQVFLFLQLSFIMMPHF